MPFKKIPQISSEIKINLWIISFKYKLPYVFFSKICVFILFIFFFCDSNWNRLINDFEINNAPKTFKNPLKSQKLRKIQKMPLKMFNVSN